MSIPSTTPTNFQVSPSVTQPEDVAVDPTLGSLNPGLTTLSADALLMYCESQLNDLDGQVNDQIQEQRTALAERQAIQTAQGVFTEFGTAGPQDVASMQKCVDALNHAIAQCPPGDPVAGQIADFRDQMVSQYGFTPSRKLSDAEKAVLADAQKDAASGSSNLSAPLPDGIPSDEATMLENQSPDQVVATLTAARDGALTHQPNKDNNEWQGTVQSLENIGDDVKSGADIELLKLQDLVSQRQQAIQLCSGMMSKTDQTLEDQAKAVGH